MRMEGREQIEKFCVGVGVDVGCGTQRFSPDVMSVDICADSKPDIVHDCKDLNIFQEQSLDFIFSSHCLEDFENIPEVFRAWWSRLKVGGMMVLLLPDMQGGRYPMVGQPNGNPSHRTDVGVPYFEDLLATGGYRYSIEQIDTVPHDSTTFDLVVKREG